MFQIEDHDGGTLIFGQPVLPWDMAVVTIDDTLPPPLTQPLTIDTNPVAKPSVLDSGLQSQLFNELDNSVTNVKLHPRIA